MGVARLIHFRLQLLPCDGNRYGHFVSNCSDFHHKAQKQWVRFNFGVKIRRLSCKCLSLSDFLRRGCATPQKITFLTRPEGAFEIVTPTLERTPNSYSVSETGDIGYN